MMILNIPIVDDFYTQYQNIKLNHKKKIFIIINNYKK